MKGYTVTVTATSAPIMGATTANPAQALSSSVAYPAAGILSNPAAGQTVYLGGPDVDTNSWPLLAGMSVEIDLVADILWGVVAGGTQAVQILRRGS